MEGVERGDVHAITQPKFARRAHLWFRWVELWFSAYADVLIHLAHTLHVVEVTSIEALIYLLFNNKILATSLSICLDVDGRRGRNNVRYLFAADWIEDVYVKDTCCGVVPCCGRVRVFVYVLDCTTGQWMAK